MSNQSVIISAFQPFTSRNILNTGVLDELLRRGTHVVVLAPAPKAAFYSSVYSSRGVIIEPIDESKFSTRAERLLQGAADLLLNTNTKLFHKRIARFEGGSMARYLVARSITATLGRSLAVKRLFRAIEWCYQPRFFDDVLRKHNPDVVFGTNVFGVLDASLIKSARRLGIRTVGLVASWDNPSSKQLLRVVPNTLLAHNPLLCEELATLHAIPDALPVGAPHYDYAGVYRAAPRSDVFGKLGIPVDRAVVLVSPAGRKFVDTDWQNLQILKDAAAQGVFVRPVHFLVRLHPTNKMEFGAFVPDANFTIEDPGVRFAGVREKDNELDLAGFNHLLDCLEHVAVVVNTLSSIVIDSCVRDRPVVTVGFDGITGRVPFEKSVQLYLEEENMAKLLSTGGAPVARSGRELIELINGYLSNPAKDMQSRRVLVTQQCMVLDGRAKQRIVDALGLPFKD